MLTPRRLRPVLLAALALAPLAPLVTTAQPAAAATSRVVLHVYDSSGARIPWSQFRAQQENGKGANGDNDMLLDPDSLTVVSGWPLASTAGTSGDPTVPWPGKPVTLSMSWPTSSGYSNLLLDLPQSGTVNFTYAAAQQAVARLGAAEQARPDYVPSTAYTQAAGKARSELASATAAGSEASQGAHGAVALDAAVTATTTMLTEYGPQYAHTHRAQRPQFGVTLDDISGGAADLATVQKMVDNDPQDGWVRIVFDKGRSAASYATEVRAARAAGLHVLGQILDSSDMAAVSATAWQQRVAEYTATLPNVEEWEVGNEVNGNWLGSGVPDKIAWASAYVKAHTSAKTMVTLYFQLGEDNPGHSMFTWAKTHLPTSVRSTIDDIAVSLYPEDHPLGGSFDRIMSTLHRSFPDQRVTVSELDYWSPDLDHTWWWGSRTDPTGAGRRAVVDLYGKAMLGYAWSGGGSYFWYYKEEALTTPALWDVLHGVHTAVLTG